jgi:hypothetical protein
MKFCVGVGNDVYVGTCSAQLVSCIDECAESGMLDGYVHVTACTES